ncbi:multidrug effflux MFS transporter [Myceligenerans pegani]|uniref:Multidrug effflux MFS transporter n=1 Tax=Myceligenerans pegani TaxID=2776917 RepID=A0ABR9N568_9MICO|nr:multidrug effflux MFS transporter [Myceligenerans sp. TRM 65318]MBE1878809.1 multidrug effflux MFS transporter [Myceligenerans sp. TRM 65318]MBE3021080.1 multidrug effflux MFS transporter [Myceligenerans sp. TRM 65318]
MTQQLAPGPEKQATTTGATARRAPARPGFLRTVLVLGALVALGPLTIDMYLPALPAIVSDLGTTEPLVQLTLTGTMLGLGLGQLAVGPLSDALGRRRPLLAGVALHVGASLSSAVAWDITVLGVLRILQGVGAAAATVVAMAVLRDLFEGRAAATAMSRLMLVMGVAPVLAPALGGAVLVAGSWRWVFGVLALLGVLVMLVAGSGLPETLPADRRRPAGIGATLGAYRSILGDTRFVLFALATGLSFGALFAYVAGSSFVLQGKFGLDRQQFALAFGGCAVALIGGAQLNPVLLARFSPSRVAGVALGGVVAAGLVGIALQAAGTGGLAGFLVPVMAMLGGGSLVIPNTTALALSRHGEAAGTAAAIVGAIQFGTGALVAPVVGVLGNDGVATATAMTGSALLAAAALTAASRAR